MTGARNEEDRDHRPSSSNLNNKGIVPSAKLLRSEVPVLFLRQQQDCSATAQGVWTEWTINKPEVVTICNCCANWTNGHKVEGTSLADAVIVK